MLDFVVPSVESISLSTCLHLVKSGSGDADSLRSDVIHTIFGHRNINHNFGHLIYGQFHINASTINLCLRHGYDGTIYLSFIHGKTSNACVMELYRINLFTAGLECLDFEGVYAALGRAVYANLSTICNGLTLNIPI